MEWYKWYEQNDPKNKKEKKEQTESSSTLDRADEYCEAVDWLVQNLDDIWMSDSSKRKISNTLKFVWWVAERTDIVVNAYEEVKNTFTTKKSFTKFMLKFAGASDDVNSLQEKSRIQTKAEDISKNLHFLWLEKDSANMENVIDECSDEELDWCIE